MALGVNTLADYFEASQQYNPNSPISNNPNSSNSHLERLSAEQDFFDQADAAEQTRLIMELEAKRFAQANSVHTNGHSIHYFAEQLDVVNKARNQPWDLLVKLLKKYCREKTISEMSDEFLLENLNQIIADQKKLFALDYIPDFVNIERLRDALKIVVQASKEG